MPHYLSPAELDQTAPAETAAFRSPIPTQIVSNGEYNPLPQTREQQRVEARIKEMADELGRRHGMSRRQFLASVAGHGRGVPRHERGVRAACSTSRRPRPQTPGVADAAGRRPCAGSSSSTCQTHFVRDDFKQDGLLGLAKYAKQNWNPALGDENDARPLQVRELRQGDLRRQRHQGGAAVRRALRRPDWDLLTNDQIAAGRAAINKIAGSRRMLAPLRLHAQEARAGWTRSTAASPRSSPTAGRATRSAIRSSRPSSARTGGSTTRSSCIPFYEKAVKSGINTICIHKGLLPADYEKSWPDVWQYATVDDLGKAAKDWPQAQLRHLSRRRCGRSWSRPTACWRSSTRPAASSGPPIWRRSRPSTA